MYTDERNCYCTGILSIFIIKADLKNAFICSCAPFCRSIIDTGFCYGYQYQNMVTVVWFIGHYNTETTTVSLDT